MSKYRLMNFIVGIIVLAAAVVPFFGKLGITGEAPSIPSIIFPILITVGGLVLLIDGFANDLSMGPKLISKKLNRGLGLLVLIGGALFLLGELGTLGFLAGVPSIVLSGILALAGFILFLDAILGVKDF